MSSLNHSSRRQQKKKEGFKTILAKTRVQTPHPPVIINGRDVTPISLNPTVIDRKDNLVQMILSKASSTSIETRDTSLTKFRAALQEQNVKDTEIFAARISMVASYHDDLFETGRSYEIDSGVISEESEPEELDIKKIPNHVSLKLQETETEFLLEIMSTTSVKGTEEGDQVEKDNNQYEFLTVGKGRNRKVVDASVQTLPVLKKTRETEAKRAVTRDNSVFVSNWIMYDDYLEIEQKKDRAVQASRDESEDLMVKEHNLNTLASAESISISAADKQIVDLMNNKRFQLAICIIERLLANNYYNEQQKRFKGLSKPDDFRENIEFKYGLNLMWTYANEETEGKCVIAISLNKVNEDIIAVGYGKYYFDDPYTDGLVMVWNIKNTVQPERVYRFNSSVMSLSFSCANPNLIAVGLYDGIVKIIDVSSITMTVIGESIPFFDPVWCVNWQAGEGDEEEILVASFGNGLVIKFEMTGTVYLKYTQIMRTPKVIGNIKGIEAWSKCTNPGIEIIRYTAAERIISHPADVYIYYVATSQGVLFKCNKNYLNQHIDLLRVHRSDINSLSFNPFANKIFITVGNDYWLRFWIEGIEEPFQESRISMHNVYDCSWSYSHSTIFVTLRERNIFVWDLQRKLYAPQSGHRSPKSNLNTAVRFSRSGECILVGDIEGNVYVYSLEDIPFKPFFQEDLVRQSLYKILVTKPELLKKVKKLTSLSYKKEDFANYFN